MHTIVSRIFPINISPFCLTLTKYTPGRVIIERSTVLQTEVLTATTSMGLRVHFLAKLAPMSFKVSVDFRQNQRRYNTYIDLKTQTVPKLSIGLLVYLDFPAVVPLAFDSNDDKYCKLLLRAYGQIQILQVTQHPITVDESRLPNNISTDVGITNKINYSFMPPKSVKDFFCVPLDA